MKKTTPERIKQLLKKLRKELDLEYPPHHWKHLKVWGKFWELWDTMYIREKEEGEELVGSNFEDPNER